MPFRTWASGHADALAVTCIDYRVIGDATNFFDSLNLTKDYDQVSLAGSALAGISPVFPSENTTFWNQLALSKKLHNIKKLIILDHRDCGAYKAAFGKDFAEEESAETEQHLNVMTQLQLRFAAKYPDLGYEGYLMALDGTVQQLI